MTYSHESLHLWSSRRFRAVALGGLAAGLFVGAPPGAALAQGGGIPCGTPHVVASGDTLSKLAESAYGDPSLYQTIADANEASLGGDPSRIAVGMSLEIPCLDGGVQAGTEGQKAAMKAAVAAEGTLSAEQLDTLFGPVALFPDKVLTPVLVAVTFPLDVVKAARFVDESSELSDKERAQKAAAEPWDDSVRELAAGFPDIVTRMNDNIDWTEQAGEVVVAQTDDVLASIQRLRAKAQTNGYLVDNEAQKVETVNNRIVISPAVPNVVQVPTYDSQVVYTTPITTAPTYHYGHTYGDDWYGWDDALVTGGIILGGAVLLDEIFDDDDWNGWDGDDEIDWDRGDITIDRGDRNIDRGDRNIDRGDRTVNIDRDRTTNGGGRISIGDNDRAQVNRGDRAARADGVREAGANRPGAAGRPERKSISSPADREVARQKIETRKAKGAGPAKLDTTRKATARTPSKATRPSNQQARPKADRPSAGARSAPRASQKVSRPSGQRSPQARSPSRSNNAFRKPPGGPRASVSSSRGKSSMGGRGGGRGGGGGGRGRR
ncbi:DUF3300 domain-containing protein [Paracoccus sp. KR1-242]|uniref:DUF3300 domain-containing protein n=1 Tax=Paracoccus sp. KR1-242 TaxID=3410028 RepID=UPI003C0C71D2